MAPDGKKAALRSAPRRGVARAAALVLVLASVALLGSRSASSPLGVARLVLGSYAWRVPSEEVTTLAYGSVFARGVFAHTLVDSPDMCCSACHLVTGCKGWTFVDGMCKLGSGQMQVKGVDYPVLSGKVKTAAGRAVRGTFRSCSFEDNLQFNNGDLPHTINLPVASKEDCCALCQALRGCQAVVFEKPTKLCWLKTGGGYRRKEDPTCTSGILA